MSLIQAIILGIIQGLTEFLPVSSSGHIQLGEAILGTTSAESLTFTIVVHAATVLSTIVIFRKQIAEIFGGLFQFKWNEETRFSLKIIVSMIPAVVVGMLFKEQIETFFSGNLDLVGASLLVTALILMLTHFAPRRDKDVGMLHALIIGVSQAIAILPGISRSGATISTALYMGIEKSRATQFSFLMVIPVILGAVVMDLKDLSATGPEGLGAGVLIGGFIAAFLAGLVACNWMVSIVRKGKLYWFAAWCAVVGLIALIV